MYSEIVPDVYDITTQPTPSGGRLRVYLFDGETPTLIDTGFEETVDRIADAVEEIGASPERLIVTHGDPDHIDGFDSLVEEFDLETWVPEQTDVSDLEHDPDYRYTEEARIGDFTPVHVPGHRADNHVLVNEDANVAVMGDAVFGSDRRGLPAGYLIPPPAAFSEDLHAAELNLDKLLEYEFDSALVFHGTSVTENASETLSSFVDFAGRS